MWQNSINASVALRNLGIAFIKSYLAGDYNYNMASYMRLLQLMSFFEILTYARYAPNHGSKWGSVLNNKRQALPSTSWNQGSVWNANEWP